MSVPFRTTLILGPTGRVGGAVVAALRASGDSDTQRRYRLFCRQPPMMSAVDQHIAGSLDDPSAISRALDGVDRLLLVTGDDPQQLARESAVIDAAAASVMRPFVVKISAITAAMRPPMSFGVMHRAAEDRLIASGLPFAIVRPAMFYQSLEYFMDPVQSMGKIIAAAGTGRVGLVDLADVGAAAAALLVGGPERFAGRMITATGPQSLSFGDVARALSDTIGRSIRHVSPPSLLARPLLKFGAGMDWWLAGQVAALFAAIRMGGEDLVSHDLPVLIGRPVRTLADYLNDNRTLWSAKP